MDRAKVSICFLDLENLDLILYLSNFKKTMVWWTFHNIFTLFSCLNNPCLKEEPLIQFVFKRPEFDLKLFILLFMKTTCNIYQTEIKLKFF